MTYDVDADSFYLRLADMEPGTVGKHILCVENSEEIILDFDNHGRLVGMEIQNASQTLPVDILDQCEKLGITRREP